MIPKMSGISTIKAPIAAIVAAMAFLAMPVAAQETGAVSAEVAPAAPVALPLPVAPAQIDPENTLYLDLSTGGRVVIRLFPEVAPAHVERIKTLTRKGFYNNVIFHRVIPGFMAQTGDPTGTGKGDSDLPDLKAEFNGMAHLRGTVAMARTEQSTDTANSQFYICFQPRFDLDKKYTVFGRVISGMQFVETIAPGAPAPTPDRILQASIAADNLPPPDFSKLPPPAPKAAEPKISVQDLGN